MIYRVSIYRLAIYCVGSVRCVKCPGRAPHGGVALPVWHATIGPMSTTRRWDGAADLLPVALLSALIGVQVEVHRAPPANGTFLSVPLTLNLPFVHSRSSSLASRR